jgi:hypothetical protein
MKCACGKTISGNKVACRSCLDAQVKKALTAPEPTGVLEILNVAAGDVKLTFDKGNPIETIRAKRIVVDMLRRGYALVVEVERGGKRAYERVQEFDEKNGEYIIADFDPVIAQEADKADGELPPLPLRQHDISAPAPQPVAKKGGRTRLPMETTKATGIGRSAGG